MKALTPGELAPAVSQVDRDWISELLQELGGTEAEPSRLLQSVAAKARLADLGEQSSALAHELRQPLFTIAMVNENLRLMLEQPDIDRNRLRQAVERSAEQVRRAQLIIDRTLSYAAATPEPQGRCNVLAAADSAVTFLAELFQAFSIIVETPSADDAAIVRVSPVEMEQVFVNLLRNAAESIHERRRGGWNGQGRIAVTIMRQGRRLRCEVSDNGAGLAPGAGAAVFQPFFTTKSGEGTGLGLHICRKILAKAEGTIQLVPGCDSGAIVEMWMTSAD